MFTHNILSKVWEYGQPFAHVVGIYIMYRASLANQKGKKRLLVLKQAVSLGYNIES